MYVAFEAGTYAVLVAVAAAVVQHSWLANWWRDPIARSSFIFKVAVVLLVIPPLVAFLHHEPYLSHPAAWELVADATSRWLAVFALLYRMKGREDRRRRYRQRERLMLILPSPDDAGTHRHPRQSGEREAA